LPLGIFPGSRSGRWKMRRFVSPVLAGVVLLAPAPVWGDEDTPATAPAGISDEEVAELVEQMSSQQFRERQEAFEKLKSLGAGIVAKLEPYRNHKDLEVRRRVQGLIDAYTWARTGVLVVEVDKGSQAESLGMRVGDVIVRINDVDIVGKGDIDKVDTEKERVFHLWRQGRIIQMKFTPPPRGHYHWVVWKAEKGGIDHAQAYVALAAGDLEEAYEHLKKAHQAGENGYRALQVLSGLAEYNLKHDEAMRYYVAYRERAGDSDSWLSHRNLEKEYHGLPVSGPHAAWLLGRLKKEKFNPELYHQAEDWFAFHGINLPLARELVQKNWPHDAGTLHQRYQHFTAKMRIALYDRDYDTVLNGHSLWPRPVKYPYISRLAIQAAVNKGDLDAAGSIAEDLLTAYREDRKNAANASFVVEAVAAAIASGNEYLADKLLAEMSRLDTERLAEVVKYVSNSSWRHGAVIPYLDAFWRRNLLDSDNVYANYLRLDLLCQSPGLEADEWVEQFKRYEMRDVWKNFDWLNAIALTRFGAYAEAERALNRIPPTYVDHGAFRKALKLQKDNRDRLEGDWSQLKGVFVAYDGLSEGTLWAVRWDGATFFIDAEGKIHEYPGLAPGQLHEGVRSDRICSYPAGTVYLRTKQFYLFDEKQKRWRPTWAAPAMTDEPYWEHWVDETFPVVLRYLLEHFPHEGPGREMLWKSQAGKWRCCHFKGDIALAVRVGDGGRGQVIDLGSEIAKLAGKAKASPGERVNVYKTRGVGENLLIPAETGLWRMNAEGKLARVELPLDDPDVMMVLLDYPKREGKLHVGVVPQQGGQVFELDEKTLAARPTGGFCGFGPQDSFATWWSMAGYCMKCAYAIQTMYEQRLAREQAGGK